MKEIEIERVEDSRAQMVKENLNCEEEERCIQRRKTEGETVEEELTFG